VDGAAAVDDVPAVDDVVEVDDLGEEEPPEQAASRSPAPSSPVSHARDRLRLPDRPRQEHTTTTVPVEVGASHRYGLHHA
jgi:hypothetical protein